VADLGTSSETAPVGSDHVEVRTDPTPLSVTTHETVTVEQPSITTMEDSSTTSGYREPDFSDHTLDSLITSLVPSYREASSPIPIPTFLGKEVINRAETSGASGASTCVGEDSGKDLAWSRGLGFEVSPIKTRSARKKAGTNLTFSAHQLSTNIEQGALRGMKSLARAKS
jgi:hypothetical protein